MKYVHKFVNVDAFKYLHPCKLRAKYILKFCCLVKTACRISPTEKYNPELLRSVALTTQLFYTVHHSFHCQFLVLGNPKSIIFNNSLFRFLAFLKTTTKNDASCYVVCVSSRRGVELQSRWIERRATERKNPWRLKSAALWRVQECWGGERWQL